MGPLLKTFKPILRLPYFVSHRGIATNNVHRTVASSLLRECYLEHLSSERLKGISVLIMARHAARNAISRNFLLEFKEAISLLQHTRETRVLILKSEVGNVFCAGADLKERASMNQDEVNRFLFDLNSTFSSLENLSMPTIAAINGAAFGGGLEMALCCDFRTAGKNAKLGLVETGLAIIPGAGGTQRLPRLIGMSKAKELIFTSKRFGPQEALSWGVVDRVSDDAMTSAEHLAQEILPNGPIAVKMAKQAINVGMTTDISNGLKVEQLCYGHILTTRDRLEGLKAFKEKRKPSYIGE